MCYRALRSDRPRVAGGVRIAVLSLVVGTGLAGAAAAADEVQTAIARGVGYLKQRVVGASAGEQSLAAYALLKSGEPADGPLIAPVVRAIRGRVTSSGYQPGGTPVYTAAVDLMALEAADPELHRRAIEAIAQYLIGRQNANGAWDYTTTANPQSGDTSQTQYALLGLWAAARAGIAVPPQVWDKSARWHIATQRPDGAWAYHPFESQEPKHTMTAAGVGSLSLVRLMLYPNARDVPRPTTPAASDRSAPAAPDRRYRFLERIDTGETGRETAAVAARPAVVAPTTPLSEIDASRARGLNWLAANFQIHTPNVYPMYYLYGLERLGALADVERIGAHDWYAEGADLLVGIQGRDGQWDGQSGALPGTSFGVLFLRKATATLLERQPRLPGRFGAGLLAGGRGLPEDLMQVQVQGGEVTIRRQISDLDDLLIALETAPAPQVAAAQAEIVDAVQLGDPEQLIGQKERLVRLADDPRPEVRRTALWALGHTGDLRLAPLLIGALQDANLDVNVDAYNALCTLSRRPGGVGLAASPVEGIAEDAPPEVRERAIAQWRTEAVARWRRWYFDIRPYDQRDDLSQPTRR